MENIEKAALNIEQPRHALTAVENMKSLQFTNNNDFYAMLPEPYYAFYNNWVRLWLQWYDGYVPWIHGGQYGILSTRLATTLVNRCADSITGGNIMFANSGEPKIRVAKSDGKTIGAALNFVSNDWALKVSFRNKLKQAIRFALAGGSSLLKLNNSGGELWAEAVRKDRYWADTDGTGNIRRIRCILSFYVHTFKNGDSSRYCLSEERRYEKIGIFGDEIPVVEYKIYKTGVPVQYFSVSDNYIRYEDLPKEIKRAFRAQYGAAELNKPVALNGFADLGVYQLERDSVSNVPDAGTGESLLANITTYLYEYDYYNTALNTDMYLARGRILVPKFMQSPQAEKGNQNSGLDDFVYTKVEGLNNDAQRPEAIQFAVRAADWREIRDILIQSIATGVGISVSTLASYISDGSNRTAREVSAEESATTLFIEDHRRTFEPAINKCIKTVLRFYGYMDDVEIRWSRAGMTNITVLTDTLSKAIQAGLISTKKAHSQYNFDDDEEQNNEDFALVEKERAQNQNSIFGGFE